MTRRLNILEGIQILSKYIKKYKKNFVMFYVGWLFDTFLIVLTPIVFSIMIDEIVYYKNLDVFLNISLVYVVMAIFSCVLYFFIYTQHQYLMGMYTFDIKLDLFKKVHQLRATYLTDMKSGDLNNTILVDAAECMHFVIRNVIHLINGLLSGIFYIFYIYIISVPAGIVITILLPFAAYMTFKNSHKIRNHTDDQRHIEGQYVSWLFEMIKGLRDIRLLNAKSTFRSQLSSFMRKSFKAERNAEFSVLASERIIEFINLVIQLSLYILCAYLTLQGELTIGNIIVLMSYVFTLKHFTIIRTAQNLMDAQSRLTKISKIYSIHSLDDETTWKGVNDLLIGKGEIKFQNIEFQYKDQKVLKGFTSTIKAGKRIALVGKSGCGKSTLGSLLLGFYENYNGRILIDDNELKQCNLKSIRQQIGIVHQDVLIFNMSIKENLRLSNPKASGKALWAACKKAGISDYIEQLPKGLESIIGPNHLQLSGGQKQRLSIARVYLKNPNIIIFDEATSALDNETEQLILKSWNELLTNRTAIVIAHSLDSVMCCDEVILMENGIVKTVGLPHDLINESQEFRDLFNIKEESYIA